jgi:hypothetical protein
VRGGQSGRTLEGWPEPEWVVLRSFFRFGDRPLLRADAQRMAAWLKDGVRPEHYEPVAVHETDVPWDDIAEPDLHWYRSPYGGKSLELFRRTTPLASP